MSNDLRNSFMLDKLLLLAAVPAALYDASEKIALGVAPTNA
jgi:hypothetical protein